MAPSNEEKPGFCQNLSQQCSAFGKFLYNSENGEVMGRSGQSWAKIGFFYLIFYGFLAGFFSAMLAVFMTTIEKPGDGGKPKLTQFIENQPGLTRLDSYEGTLESFDATKANESAYVKFVKKYFNDKITNNPLYKGGACKIALNNSISKPCYAPFSVYGPCAPTPDNTTFGLNEKKPCVFIRINRVYGWMPKGNGNYLKLECSGTGFEAQYPEGFLLNGFPYEGGKDHELPYVAVKVNAELSVKVRCVLKGPGIEVSDSFNPSRAFGKIEIKGISANK